MVAIPCFQLPPHISPPPPVNPLLVQSMILQELKNYLKNQAAILLAELASYEMIATCDCIVPQKMHLL